MGLAMRTPRILLVLLAALVSVAGAADEAAAQTSAGEWQPLFDGRSLQGWREVPFTAAGNVTIANGVITLGTGAMTGIVRTGPFPKSNYEVRLEAARIAGHDFFAAITFPVKDSYCTWVNGGWGGSTVGLSSLDGNDASENETTSGRTFENGRWYKLRLRVTDQRVQAWIDDEEMFDVAVAEHRFSLYPSEIDLCVPFGFASYDTTGALRKIEYRLLPRDAAQ